MDVFAKLLDCEGQAADAVSAYTQVKLEDASRLLKIPNPECPDVRIRLTRHKWPKSWSSMEDPVVPLERNLYGHLLAGLLWERQSEGVLIRTWMGKSTELGMSVCSQETRTILIGLCLTTLRGLERKQHIAPMWKKLMKDVDLDEPTSFFRSRLLGMYSTCMQTK